jgi:putative nucleotidyltransferase with HDIG domain
MIAVRAADGAVATTSLTTLLDALDRLPARGNTALRVLWLADDPRTPLDELTAAVEADPVLVTRLLQLVNSPFHNLRNPIASVDRAIVMLGYATVRTVATVVACGLGTTAPVPEGFWPHAAATAHAARLLAWRFDVPAGDAFTVGLLHDLGRALIFAADPHTVRRLEASVDDADARGVLHAERAAFGLTHPEAAARVLRAWRFPPQLVEAIAHHHDTVDSAPSDLARLLLAAEVVATDAVGGEEPVERDAALALVDLEPARLKAVVSRVRTESGDLIAVLAG